MSNQAVLRLLRFAAQQADHPAGITSANHQIQEADPEQIASRQVTVSAPDLPSRLEPPSPLLRRKAAIGPLNDPIEHEADRAASQVMQISDSQLAMSAAPLPIAAMDTRRPEKQAGQTTPAVFPEAAARKAPGIVDDALSSPGQPLDESTRGYFEPRFGFNFGTVRVHTDDAAMLSAAVIGARAYTYGSHIVFAAGERPGADRLTGHELTHVVQNVSGGGPAVIRRSPAEDAYEIVSSIWSVSGRDVVVVRMKANGRSFFFYRRTGTGSKGQFEPYAPAKDAWVPFEGFEEGEKLRGSTYTTTDKFHKEPYYYSPDVREGRVAPGYGTQTNKDIAEWLDRKIPPGTIKGEVATWEKVQEELARYNARNLPYPGTEAPQEASTASGEIGSWSVTRTGAGGMARPGATATGEITVPQRGSVTLKGGATRSVTTASGEINVTPPKGGFGAGLKSGFKAVFSAENIAAMIPDVVLAIADKVAAREAIRNIEIKFTKEGFAKGVAAGVTGWTPEEVASNLRNQVTELRVKGLEDPAGFLTVSFIHNLAEAYENHAVDLGFQFSSSKTAKWKEEMRTKGFAVLTKRGYSFEGDPETYLFKYRFIDKLAWVLQATTNPIVEEAIK